MLELFQILLLGYIYYGELESVIFDVSSFLPLFRPHSRHMEVPRRGGELEMHLLLSLFFFSFRAIPTAYGGSQARGRIGAVATGLHHSHSNAASEPHLQPTPQLTAMPDP